MILLVEDDEDVREMIKFTLEGRGFPVVDVANGADALAFLRDQRPCLIILDLVMPVMTGWQVLAEMRARGLAHIPTCVISALPDRAPSDAVAILRKPFEIGQLLELAGRFCPLSGTAAHHP